MTQKDNLNMEQTESRPSNARLKRVRANKKGKLIKICPFHIKKIGMNKMGNIHPKCVSFILVNVLNCSFQIVINGTI